MYRAGLSVLPNERASLVEAPKTDLGCSLHFQSNGESRTGEFLRGPLAGCEARLSAAGFALSPSSWTGDSTVSYRAGVLWIEAAFVEKSQPLRRQQRQRNDLYDDTMRVPDMTVAHEVTLGLHANSTCDLATIKRAYRTLSRAWHPDKWANFPLHLSVVTQAFEAIRGAYDELMNKTATCS